jgi:benzoate-CoA ligase family protein
LIRLEDIPRELNLATHFVDRHVDEGRGERTALICAGDREYSYADLADRTNRIGNVLREVGVRPEERVLLALSDGVDFVASWYAVIKLGAVVAEAYTFLQPKDYAYYLEYTRARVVIADSVTLPAIREVAARASHLQKVIVAGGHPPLEGRELSLADLVEDASPDLAAEPTARDDIAIWKFTTGSTGTPKAAVHCMHDPLISFENYARDVLDYRPDDRVLPVPKLFFGYARDAAALFTFGVGAAGIVFPERSTAERLFELIAEHRPTILVQVPAMMRAMLGDPAAERADLTSLRLCISSGEALPGELYQAWMDRFGVEVLDGVGSSEAYHIYLSNRPGAVRGGSVGQLVPGYDARLLNAEGNEVPEGEAGELRIAGESTALMYWGDHEKSKATFAGDWIRTGDLFARDADGYFWYRGRADDLLKVRGIWVAPQEIEQALMEHDAVADCAVVGVERGDGLIPRAYVVPSAPESLSDDTAAELQDFVRSRLAPHKYPREIRFMEDLPRTASGKVDRRALRSADDLTATQRG